MKRISILFVILSLVLMGCGTKTPETAFQAYLDQLLVDSLDPTDIGINFSFIDPEKFGITPEPYNLGFTTEEDFNESYKSQAETIKTLKSYPNKDLTEQEIMDRDALIAGFEMSMDAQKYYEYEVGANVLGFSRAFSGNVPAYLETYDFHSERDVIGYLNFIETLKASYQHYLDLELKRQVSGTGYGQEELDEIIKQAKDSAEAMAKEDYFLIADFETKVTQLKLPNEAEYLAKQKSLINNDLVAAYQLIVDVLSDVDAQPTTGLANKPNGKAYYEYLLQSSTGSKKSVKEIKKIVEQKKYAAMITLASLGANNDTEAMFKRYEDNNFGEFNDGYELLGFLDKEMLKDFPPIGEVNYELKQVDESMAEASSPAFYFTPYTDYTPEHKQTIYINGEFDNKLYQTYAHEGYPGHMYQFNYFLGLGMHPIRMLFTESSNAEGWANYIESVAHNYIEDDKDFVEFTATYNEIVQLTHIEMDLGVNYDGWTKDGEFAAYLLTNFGIDKQEVIDEIFLSFTHNPAVYPTYYLSSIYIREMKDRAKMELGDKYTDVEFHEAFLKSGSVGFDFIEKQIDAYIANKSK